MTSKCRAKNPDECRVHGNPTITNLQKQADKAAMAGDMKEYFNLREQIDAAIDNPAGTAETSSYPLDDATLAAGEDGWYSAVNEWEVLTDQDRSWEENKLLVMGVKHAVKRVLQAADEHMPDGKITPEALQVAADKVFELTYGNNSKKEKPDAYFKAVAKEILESTRQK